MKYNLQLDKLKAVIASWYGPFIMLLLDFAMPIRKKLLDFEWDVLPHPPYSPDLASSNYYLFFFEKFSSEQKNLYL